MAVESCPVVVTQRLVHYLAGERAGRCGPCHHGLPALASSFSNLTEPGALDRVRELLDLVDGRGACAHPDGTARLVRSLVSAFDDEVERHAEGWCGLQGRGVVRHLRRVAS
jgi:NADH:ubiquinone oxidoreductase subunit F (NADH-binding)